MVSVDCFPDDLSVEDDSRMESSFDFMPPRLSISLRTVHIQASISSALSRTSRKLVAAFFNVAFCVRSRERREFFGPGSNDPSS